MATLKRAIFVFCGQKASGKDTCAKFLREYYHTDNPSTSVIQVNFADKVRAASRMLFHLSNEEMSDHELKETLLKRWPWQSPRYILQRFATEAMRGQWPDIWTYHWQEEVAHQLKGRKNVIITTSDLRFPNEQEAIRYTGHLHGIPTRIVNVSRPASLMPDLHESESYTGRLGHNFEIVNDGTLDDLKTKVWELLQ